MSTMSDSPEVTDTEPGDAHRCAFRGGVHEPWRS